MAEVVDEATKEKLKATLWFSIGKIVDEETQRLNTTATPQFIGTLTEMVWTQIENIAVDLQTFAHHASRSTINTDDVLLLTRRNEALEGIIREFVDANRSAPKSTRVGGDGVRGKNGGGGGGGKKSGGGGGAGVKTGRVDKGKGKGRGK